CARLQVEFDVW
nr:immunoglobulin heavy chain junction region [Macaca mulatta]MOW19289.1 immunoglobulin heavy chain junction region [Macaca mulatta]MOW19989.1 immunoglobulin heavy chain junction region [Macaca mulatta]MOW21227.1 immunoglobulin heavy chain junction region [Macaca mulatta]MOW21789.1 immunoglobulin heavy chain junction region [Macaca mulatta]